MSVAPTTRASRLEKFSLAGPRAFGFPDATSLPYVRVATGLYTQTGNQPPQNAFVEGFLLREDAESFTVFVSNVSEFTTSCNFCSCGCGMIAAVRDGRLVKMEGDYDHIVNRGINAAQCVANLRQPD